MIKKLCKTCGKEFGVLKHRKDSAKFCSRDCKHESGRTKKTCLFCGKLFKSTRHRNLDYCSRECVDNSKKRRVIRICQICDKEYEVQKYYAGITKYCSILCRNKGISRANIGKFAGELNPNYKGMLVKICQYCGNLFQVYQYRKDTAEHCSISCSKLNTKKETRIKIANSIRELQKKYPELHPNHILAQKGHITKIEKHIKDELVKRKLAFEFQFKLLSYWIDFAFPESKLAIEVDGKRWHSTDKQIQKDQIRDKRITDLGWIVMRFGEKEIMDNPSLVVDKIEKIIGTGLR